MTETLADRIEAQLKLHGLTASAASVQARLNAGFVGDILKGKAKNPRTDSMAKLAAVLQCSLEWLLYGDGPALPPAVAEIPTGNTRPAKIRLPSRSEMPRDIEVRGTAAGSMAGAFQFEDHAVDYVARPPGLAGASGVYALYIEGYSMIPEHNPGDLRFVSPYKKPNIGDSVVITAQYSEHGPVESFIKRLVKRSGSSITVEQFNPKAQLEFDLHYVKSMHKVLTVNDLFGI
ncbi:MAG: helix-turn-helix transcriptional regulator [Bosea sp.]|uniref:XRE family transcriptional regulator n=1 Tax=Bosea sp. (in: a-proteobacteria) TaxID=1871050 RepID=UPI0023A444B1|nr:helix-turn-helix transcriptional regulator [Bosea sp. (in: a-proteobacteria)]MCP4738481.1 helix-turn-helix transcriptional regulator [Bosea sp. (in: a-proteobacteria)]